jgi:cholesterol transport system auxiliary component
MMTRSTHAIVVAASLVLGACAITQPAATKQSFLLNPIAPAATPAGHPHVLRVNRFVVAQPFDGRSLVYRTEAQRYEADYYNEFLAQPATMLTEGAMRYLVADGAFRAAVPMNSSVDARYVLEGAVASVHGDFRAGQSPAAVLAIRFLLVRDDISSGLVYERLIERRVDFEVRSARALVVALDAAYGSILAELARDLRALKLPSAVIPVLSTSPR